MTADGRLLFRVGLGLALALLPTTAFAAPLSPSEVKCHQLNEAQDVEDVRLIINQCGMAPKDTLIVFDIDNTLLKMNQDLGSDAWYNWQSDLLKGPPSNFSVAKDVPGLLKVQRLIYDLGGMTPPEPSTPELVADLRRQGYPVMMLTGRGPDMMSPTLRELAADDKKYIFLGQPTCGDIPCEKPPACGQVLCSDPGVIQLKTKVDNAELGVVEVKAKKDAVEFADKCFPQVRHDTLSRPIAYADGVLMASGQDKGVLLQLLLASSTASCELPGTDKGTAYKDVGTYKSIIFVDDTLKNVVNVDTAFKGTDLATSARYAKLDEDVEAFNKSSVRKADTDRSWRALRSVICTQFSQLCPTAGPTTSRTLTLMSWNVDNLFDTENDPNNPFDDTYLPLATKQLDPNHNEACAQRFSEEAEKACRGVANPRTQAARIEECETIDWTNEKLNRKLGAIADVLLTAQPLPDVIIMPELENRDVLAELNKKLGYPTVVELDTTDTKCDRGIDVGVLTRLPVGEPKAHKVEFGTDAPICGSTRDITEVPLTLPGGRILYLFAVHFPSGNKAICREHAMQKLNEVKAALPAGAMAIAGGDFNFICSDAQGDAFAHMLSDGHWQVPPEVRKGCAEPGSEEYDSHRPNGELWPTWSFLDTFLVSDNLVADATNGASWFANLGSFRTAVVSSEQVATSSDGKVTPKDTNLNDGSGVSDHWPVLIDLVPRQ